MQVFNSPQKFERPLCLNGCSYGIKNYCFEVTFNDMTSLLNLIKNQPTGAEVDSEDRHTDWMAISLAYFFL
jgi:hypothetical protein